MNFYKKTLQLLVGLFFVLVVFSSCKEAKKENQEKKDVVNTIYLIGDSTMADYTGDYDPDKDYMKTRYPVAGWGQVFQLFLASDSLFKVKNLIKTDSAFVDDRARGGRSTRTFFQEGRWRSVFESLKKDDIVLMQFGHNDAAESKTDRYVNIEGYKEFLRLFVSQTREKGAIPIILTPVARNYPWKDGKLQNVHGEYDQAPKNVANELNVMLIDLNRKSMDFFTKMGETYVTENYFMNLPPDLYEAYPNGQIDNTHFQPKGATEVARLVFEGMQELNSIIACKKTINKTKEITSIEKIVPENLKWSERMALSIMKRNPQVWNVDQNVAPKWDYKVGLLLTSYEKLYHKTHNQRYFNYIKEYADMLIDSSGTIQNYNSNDYNIDLINAGKILFNLYDKTHEEKYIKALQTLRGQLKGHPRTKSGGFWHKKIYPNQMWLDGLYMGQPFYARYTSEFENGAKLNDVAHQFELIHDHTLNKKTGLYFHAWDESKLMDWANKETGTAPNSWLRALGWYGMALVDVLDYFPKEHPKQQELVGYLNELAVACKNYQDTSGLWFQVPDLGDKEGNYLEASGSAMLTYTFAKGVHNGYLPEEYLELANKAFKGLITELIEVDDDGEIHITQVCGSAGLGGDPYRDGSYEYYMSEKIKIDNSHGLGPFILAAIELNK